MKTPLMDPRIQNRLPKHTESVAALMKTRLQLEGCVHEFAYCVIGGIPIQLDGHHRREYCRELNIKIKGWHLIKLTSIEQAIEWAVDHQLGQRNLTEEQESYYRGKEYQQSKRPFAGRPRSEEAKCVQDAPISEPRGRPTEKAKCGNDYHILQEAKKTAERLAEKHGVSEKTIRLDAEFAQAVDQLPQDDKAKVLAGKSELTKKKLVANSKPKPKAEPRKSKPPKAGAIIFDWAKWHAAMGTIVRQLTSVANHYRLIERPKDHPEETAAYNAMQEVLNDLIGTVKEWYESLTKLPAPEE